MTTNCGTRVQDLATKRAGRRVTLEPHIVQALGRPYTTRHDERVTSILPGPRDAHDDGPGSTGAGPQDGDGDAPRFRGRGLAASRRAALTARLDEDQDQDDDTADWSTDDAETDREFQSLITASWEATVQATEGIQEIADAAAERDEDESRTRWETRRQAQRLTDAGTEIPDRIKDPVMDLLTDRGDEGATRAEIAEHLGLSTTQATDWLRVMLAQHLITRRGKTRNAVYLHPRHTPTTDPSADDGQ